MTAKKQLLHTPIDVTVNGETISIRPFPFGQQHIVVAKLLPLFQAFQGLREGAEVSYGAVVEAGGENLMEVLALAAGKPRDFMDTIYDYDEGKALAMAVFEANKEQFLKKILPDLMNMMGKQAPATQTEVPAAA